MGWETERKRVAHLQQVDVVFASAPRLSSAAPLQALDCLLLMARGPVRDVVGAAPCPIRQSCVAGKSLKSWRLAPNTGRQGLAEPAKACQSLSKPAIAPAGRAESGASEHNIPSTAICDLPTANLQSVAHPNHSMTDFQGVSQLGIIRHSPKKDIA